MKKRLLVFVFILTLLVTVKATGTGMGCDSCKVTQSAYNASLEKELVSLKSSYEDLEKKEQALKDNLKSIETELNYQYFYDKSKETKFRVAGIVLFILLPILFFAILFWVKVKLTDFDLKKALSSIKLIENITTDAAGNQTKVNREVEVESSSRLLAFLSGIVALILSFTLILVSIYTFLNSGIMPDFSKLVNSVIALGIGIVPYSINKIAGTFKSNNT